MAIAETVPSASGRADLPIGTVLITGGASGLGAATAGAIEAAGGTAIVLDRTPTDVGTANVTVDLADTAAATRAVREVVDAHRGVDAVVTAAGIDTPGQLLDVSQTEWERIVAVNLLGTAAVVRAALPSLLERRGHVVTVASTLGHRAVADATAYCASKFGVVGFTRALACETKGRLRVTLITPGGMDTAFFDRRADRYKPAAGAQLCRADDIAATIVFALTTPAGCEIKELVVGPETETSWP